MPPSVSIAQDAAELHVLPHARTGGWMVAPASDAAALSWHGTAGEAELAAQRHAAGRSASRIYLHDRYQRVRTIIARPEQPAAATPRGARPSSHALAQREAPATPPRSPRTSTR